MKDFIDWLRYVVIATPISIESLAWTNVEGSLSKTDDEWRGLLNYSDRGGKSLTYEPRLHLLQQFGNFERPVHHTGS